MATFNSDLAALEADPRMGNRIDPIKHKAGMLISTPIVTVDATEVEDDLLSLVKQPERTRLVPELSYVVTDGVGGTSAIISVGTASNPDKYASALDVTAAGLDNFGVSGDDDVVSDPITTEGGEQLYAKLTTLTAAMTAGKKLKFVLVFAAVV